MTRSETAEERAEREAAEKDRKLSAARKRWLELEEQREEIAAEQDRLKAEARELLADELGKHEISTGEVVLSPNRRFSPEKAAEVVGAISADLVEACKETVITSKKAKDILPPAVYRQCMNEGLPKVEFR